MRVTGICTGEGHIRSEGHAGILRDHTDDPGGDTQIPVSCMRESVYGGPGDAPTSGDQDHGASSDVAEGIAPVPYPDQRDQQFHWDTLEYDLQDPQGITWKKSWSKGQQN